MLDSMIRREFMSKGKVKFKILIAHKGENQCNFKNLLILNFTLNSFGRQGWERKKG